jgi:aspartate/methionine/tyrosine aminotransferase
VFSPLFHNDTPTPPPFVSLGYPQSVSTGSVSKAHGLPGIRLGWVVSPNQAILHRVVTARDYTTFSVSRLDDGVASFALSPTVLPRLMKRNLAICKASIALLDSFVARNTGRCTWVRPNGGGTAFIRFFGPDGSPINDASFASRIGERIGVSFIPGGHSFSDDGAGDFKGYLRMSIGDDKMLRAGLERLQNFITDSVSLV